MNNCFHEFPFIPPLERTFYFYPMKGLMFVYRWQQATVIIYRLELFIDLSHGRFHS